MTPERLDGFRRIYTAPKGRAIKKFDYFSIKGNLGIVVLLDDDTVEVLDGEANRVVLTMVGNGE